MVTTRTKRFVSRSKPDYFDKISIRDVSMTCIYRHDLNPDLETKIAEAAALGSLNASVPDT